MKVFLKTNFHKISTTEDGLHPQCKSCIKQYYDETPQNKLYCLKSRDRINEYFLRNYDRIIALKMNIIKTESKQMSIIG